MVSKIRKTRNVLIVVTLVFSLTMIPLVKPAQADTNMYYATIYGLSGNSFLQLGWYYAYLSEMFDSDSYGYAAIEYLYYAALYAYYAAYYAYYSSSDYAYDTFNYFADAYNSLVYCYSYAIEYANTDNTSYGSAAGNYGLYASDSLTYGLYFASRYW